MAMYSWLQHAVLSLQFHNYMWLDLQELKSKRWLDMRATLLYYPDTPMQTTRSSFTGIIFVTLFTHITTMECMVLLGHTNKATIGVKLLLATVSTWQVNCGCLCTSMNTQWLFFWSIVNLLPSPNLPPINWVHDIGEAWIKSVWNSSGISYCSC